MKKLISLLFLTFCLAFALCACGSSDNGGDKSSHKVMLSLPEGVSVVGENPIMVEDGGTAKFKLNYGWGYMFDSVSHGSYNYDTAEVVIKDVRDDVSANLVVNKYDFDTSVKYRYLFYGTDKDTSSVPHGIEVNAGIVARLYAGDMGRRFLGWSIGSGGPIVSTEREFSLVISGETASDAGVVAVYPNYSDSNSVYYHPNGGEINTATTNFKDKQFYTAFVASLDGESTLKLQVNAKYFSKVESHSSLYDDGTIYRPGYVLVEYNTKADGTGEAFSLGSKVYLSPDEENPMLYCIWKQATPADQFSYTTIEMPCPTDAAYAPDWQTSGLIITGYLGNDAEVVIPEKINGKPVIAIAEGAIVGKNMKTLVLNRRIQKVENGAIANCPKLSTMYFADSIYEMYNEALDSASTAKLANIYVNATMAPRFTKTLDGAHAIKLSRLLAYANEPRLIVIGGSSVFEGLGTEYLEALLDGDYRVINFGTTRTTHCTMYLEAMAYYANESDVIVYSPENSSYLLGERELYWKSLRDLEGMNNIYRYVDMTQYTNFFSAFTDFNRNYRYQRAATRYEDIANYAYTDGNGDHTRPDRQSYVKESKYQDVYYPSFNNRTKSRFDVDYKGDATANKEDYNNPDNNTWCSIDDPYYLEPMNRIINAARSSGAKVYFAFCPADADSLVEAAKNTAWLRAYDTLIAEIYDFDGVIGKCEDYVYNHQYFYDCAFHLNDYGRTYRTYQFYLDICSYLGRSAKYGITDLGTSFDGCLFESNTTGKPQMGVNYLTEG